MLKCAFLFFYVNNLFIFAKQLNKQTEIMKAFKTFEVEGTKREYFLLNDKKAKSLGWNFAIEVVTTNESNNLIVRNRYFCNSELDINNGINYWSKYTSK